jgi:hypothetical protein
VVELCTVENSSSTPRTTFDRVCERSKLGIHISAFEDPSVVRSGEGQSAGHHELSDPNDPQVRRSLVNLVAKGQSLTSLRRANQIHIIYSKRSRQLVNSDDRRIAATVFKATDVLLAKARYLGEPLLREALFLS